MVTPLRICDVTTLYIDGGEGGVNTYLREKARYLRESPRSFRHSMIVPTGRTGVRRLERSILHGIASPRFFGNRQHRVLFNHRSVADILRRERPHVIEVDCASFLPRVVERALAAYRPPIVGFYHVHLPGFYARPWGLSLGKGMACVAEGLAWGYLRHCARPCDRILVPSREILRELQERRIRGLELLPLGVNPELFRPAVNGSSATHPIRERPTILYVGRLSKEKDLPLLFSVHDRLSGPGGFRLRVVGDGPLRNQVEEFARTREHVEYLGEFPYGEKLARLYREADVLAVPSPCETFGLIVLEALASGIPVVAVRRGGPAQLVGDGVGALARPGDAADFASKVERVVRERASSCHYRNHAIRQYSWKRTFDRLMVLYQRLLGERAADGGETVEPRELALGPSAPFMVYRSR